MIWRLLFVLSIVLSLGLSPIYAQPMTNSFTRVLNLIDPDAEVDADVFDETLLYGEYSDWLTIAEDVELEFAINEDAFVTYQPQVIDNSWTTLILIAGDDGGTEIIEFTENEQDIDSIESHVTFVNLLDESVELYLDQALFAEALAPSIESSLSVDLIANSYEVLVNQDEDLARKITFEPQKSYVLLIFDYNGAISYLAVESSEILQSDDVTTDSDQVPEEYAIVRFGHLSSGTPPIHLYLNGDVTPITTLRFPQMSQWFQLPAGQHEIIISLAEENINEPLLDPIDFTLEANQYGNFVLIGALANNSLDTHYLDEPFEELGEASARISFFNAHPASGPVDIRLASGASLIDRLAYPGYFGSNDGFTSVILDSGQYDIEAITSDDGGMLFELINRNFIAGRNYYIAIIAADPPFLLTFSDVEETRSLLENMAEDE